MADHGVDVPSEAPVDRCSREEVTGGLFDGNALGETTDNSASSGNTTGTATQIHLPSLPFGNLVAGCRVICGMGNGSGKRHCSQPVLPILNDLKLAHTV